MTEDQQLQYWRKYANQTTKYERNGVVTFRRAIADLVKPVATHAANFGAQSAIDMLDVLVARSVIENAYIEYFLYVGTTHKLWTDQDLRGRLGIKKDRGVPSLPLVEVEPADAGFGAGFFNPKWLQKLKRLVYDTEAAKRVTSITNTLKKKLRAVLGRAVKEEVRPSVIARRIETEMGGKFSESRARLIARTETTRIANLAAKESALETMELGILLDKIWIDTRDALVRDHHWNLPDPIDFYDKFKIGDKLMDMPGDPEGGAEECCNCRCCHAYLPKDDRADIFPDIPKK